VLTNSLASHGARVQGGRTGFGADRHRRHAAAAHPFVRRALRGADGPGHFAERLFFAVKGVAPKGMLTDADPLEAELKRTMIEQAGEAVLLIDQSKLSTRGLSVIAPVGEVATTLAAGLDESEADALRLGGTSVIAVG
jgi:DeoR/GlpR family transcriptional regulator of sugar metabolism